MTTCFIKKQPNNPNNLYCGFQKSFNDIRFYQNEHLIQINVQPHLSKKQFCQLLFWKMLGHQFKRVIISWFALFQLIWQLIYCLWLKLIIQIHVHCWIYLDSFTWYLILKWLFLNNGKIENYLFTMFKRWKCRVRNCRVF